MQILDGVGEGAVMTVQGIGGALAQAAAIASPSWACAKPDDHPATTPAL